MGVVLLIGHLGSVCLAVLWQLWDWVALTSVQLGWSSVGPSPLRFEFQLGPCPCKKQCSGSHLYKINFIEDVINRIDRLNLNM